MQIDPTFSFRAVDGAFRGLDRESFSVSFDGILLETATSKIQMRQKS